MFDVMFWAVVTQKEALIQATHFAIMIFQCMLSRQVYFQMPKTPFQGK